MNSDNDQFEPGEAQKALDSINFYQSTGLKRGIPSLWFGITMAVLGGVSITIAGLKVSKLLSLSLSLFMAMLCIRHVLKVDVRVKPLLSTRALIMVMIGIGLVCLPVVLIAQANLDTFGPSLAWGSGIVFAIVCSIAVLYERHRFIARMDAEK